jgi:hypothetical protein
MFPSACPYRPFLQPAPRCYRRCSPHGGNALGVDTAHHSVVATLFKLRTTYFGNPLLASTMKTRKNRHVLFDTLALPCRFVPAFLARSLDLCSSKASSSIYFKTTNFENVMARTSLAGREVESNDPNFCPSEVLGRSFLGIYICIYCPEESKKTEFRLSAMPGPFEDVERPDRGANQAPATEQEIHRTRFGTTKALHCSLPRRCLMQAR